MRKSSRRSSRRKDMPSLGWISEQHPGAGNAGGATFSNGAGSFRRYLVLLFLVPFGYLMHVCVMPYLSIGGITPNLLFAIDGEVYDLDGIKTIAIGGAYSVDKYYRLAMGWNWWADEQPSAEIKAKVEQALAARDWNIDIVLSHTVPLKYEPVEVFMSGFDQSKVDKSTEIWLDSIEDRLTYKHWYAGHYHTEKTIDKLTLMFESIHEYTTYEEEFK